MGIKFLCTQCGKKLNVKAFLAGKRAICPHCSNKIEIPPEAAEHTIVTGASPLAAMRGSGGAAAMATHPLSAPTGALPVRPAMPSSSVAPALRSAAGHPSAMPAASPLPAAHLGAPAAMPAMPSAAPATALPAYAAPAPALPMPAPLPPQPAAPPDPITEAPTAVWYVRPPTGGQFGPAPGDTMRKWITEGRVTADSLVWREGWADWKNAGGIFPSLGATLPPPASTTPSITAPTKSTPLTTRGGGSNSLAMTLVIVLIVLIVPLLGILIWVLTRNHGNPTPPRKDTARAVALETECPPLLAPRTPRT